MKLVTRQPGKADDNVGRGIDLALVTLAFLGIGYALDRWLGTQPLFMICLVILSIIGQFFRMWFEYDDAMRAHERDRADLARRDRMPAE